MISMYWKGEEDLFRSLVRLESKVEKGSGQFVREAAEWLRNDIRKHWSPSSPSPKGRPPAMVTENLDSSVIIDSGRDLLGRFATGDNVKVMFVRINTTEGHDPQGRGNYAQPLEFSYNRPFVEPAIERLSGHFPKLAKDNIRL